MKNAVSTAMLAIVCIGFLSGCAEIVTKTYRPTKGGTVKYSQELFLTEKNRAKAMELADQYCAPSRAVVMGEDNKSEFTGHSTTSSTTNGNTSTGEINQSKQSNIYIHFTCGRGGTGRVAGRK